MLLFIQLLVVVTFFNHNFVNCKATLILAIKICDVQLLKLYVASFHEAKYWSRIANLYQFACTAVFPSEFTMISDGEIYSLIKSLAG